MIEFARNPQTDSEDFPFLLKQEEEENGHRQTMAITPIESAQLREDVLNNLCAEQHQHGLKMGWSRNTEGEGLMLIVTELAEAMEEVREGKDVRELYFDGDKPCGVPSELADVIIRVASYCGFRGIDLGAAVEAKLAYNATRAFRHGGKLL